MPSELQKLGQRIRSIRRTKKLSQAKLAEYAGLSVRFIAAVERNEKLPSLESLAQIANSLDTPLYLLFKRPSDRHAKSLDELLAYLSDKTTEQISTVLDIARLIIPRIK